MGWLVLKFARRRIIVIIFTHQPCNKDSVEWFAFNFVISTWVKFRFAVGNIPSTKLFSFMFVLNPDDEPLRISRIL